MTPTTTHYHSNHNDTATRNEIWVRIADIYLTSLNDYDNALAYLTRVEESGLREQESMALMQLSAVYLSQGRYDRMLVSLKKCLDLLSPPMNDFERSQVFDIYSNMAEAYFLLRDFGKAEEAENNACRLARSIKDKSGNMHLLESMGNRAFNLGYFERAIDHYKSAVLMAHELKDAGSAIRMHKSMGYVYLSLHAAEDTFKVLNEALSLSKEHGLTYYMIDTLTAIGYAEENEGRYEEALVKYEEALNLSESSEEFALLAVTCRKSIAGIKAAKGEIGEAILPKRT